jgi:serine/threonine-protein kinase RsbT
MAIDKHLPIKREQDIVTARQSAREAASQLGFGTIDQSRIATAVSELTRNVIRYATDGAGDIVIREVAGDRGVGLEIVVSDEGPGIADIEQVMQDGFTSGQGMGLGLPGTKRLMDEMALRSEAGSGTVVTIVKWRR